MILQKLLHPSALCSICSTFSYQQLLAIGLSHTFPPAQFLFSYSVYKCFMIVPSTAIIFFRRTLGNIWFLQMRGDVLNVFNQKVYMVTFWTICARKEAKKLLFFWTRKPSHSTLVPYNFLINFKFIHLCTTWYLCLYVCIIVFFYKNKCYSYFKCLYLYTYRFWCLTVRPKWVYQPFTNHMRMRS